MVKLTRFLQDFQRTENTEGKYFLYSQQALLCFVVESHRWFLVDSKDHAKNQNPTLLYHWQAFYFIRQFTRDNIREKSRTSPLAIAHNETMNSFATPSLPLHRDTRVVTMPWLWPIIDTLSEGMIYYLAELMFHCTNVDLRIIYECVLRPVGNILFLIFTELHLLAS